MTPRDWLGLHPSSPQLTFLTPAPQIKSYPDAVYFNYFTLGLSLLFSPQNGYKPITNLKLHELEDDNLVLESIYIYNAPHKDARSNAENAYSTYSYLPLALVLTAEVKDKDGKPVSRPFKLDVLADSSGKDFVQTLGEPDRKGGGTGPSSGSIGIWCEWTRDGIMVEFGGDEARGPQAWERGKDAIWKIITIFPPT